MHRDRSDGGRVRSGATGVLVGLLVVALVTLQAAIGPLSEARAAAGGIGDPASGPTPSDRCDLGRGIATAAGDLTLSVSSGDLVCSVRGGAVSDRVALSAVGRPLEASAGGDVVALLDEGASHAVASFGGLPIELSAGGVLILDASGVVAGAGRGARITVTATGLVGHGLEGVRILAAATVAFVGSDLGDRFDASAIDADMPEISGGDGDDVLLGGSGDDSIEGGEGSDRIEGGDGDDAIAGGDGGDRLAAGPGDDAIDCSADVGVESCAGGPGDDEITVSTTGPGVPDVTVAPGDGADRIEILDDGATVTLDHRDTTVGVRIVLDPSPGGACGASSFGPDTVGGACGAIVAVVGTSLRDVIDASSVATDGFAISGRGGDDTLLGGSGDDVVLRGGPGDDRLSARGVTPRLFGGPGDDRLIAADADAILVGGSGDDVIRRPS